MSSKTRLRVACLPLVTGLALAGCSDDSTNAASMTPGDPSGAAGTSNAGGMGGAPAEGIAGSPPTGIVACDESVIGGAAPNTLTVDVDGAATLIPKEIFGVLLEI